MTDFAAILHASPPADASRPVIVPGEIELDKMEHQRKHGLRIDADTLRVLRRYAAASRPSPADA
jgi:LDH2 family malate/lactate/ureidoglycolate dehydrogenase